MFGKEKIRVEILNDKGMRSRKCLVEGNNVIIHKGKGVRGDPSVMASFDKKCLVPYKSGFWPFRKLRLKLVWKEGNKRCISFYGSRVALSHPDIKGFFNAGAIKNAGSTLTTVKIPLAFYLIVGAVLVMQIVTLLFSSGRLRIV